MEARQRSLIVIDDETELNEILVEMVQRLGYKVLSAKDGAEAFEILMSHDVDAALCDITMPKMTGIELLTRLRGKGNNTPFVFLTGHTSLEYVLSAVQLGVTEFLQKPYGEEQLSRSVERVLDIGMRMSRIKETLLKLASQSPENQKLVEGVFKDKQQIERLRASAVGSG